MVGCSSGGRTFKEDCPDLCNTRVVDVTEELRAYDIEIDLYYPWASPAEALHEYGLRLAVEPQADTCSGILIAVGHRQLRHLGTATIRKWGRSDHLMHDVMYTFDACE